MPPGPQVENGSDLGPFAPDGMPFAVGPAVSVEGGNADQANILTPEGPTPGCRTVQGGLFGLIQQRGEFGGLSGPAYYFGRKLGASLMRTI